MLTQVKVGPNVITVNLGRTFMVSELDGSIRASADQGLFASDVRFLSHYRYRINGRQWHLLTSAPTSHTTARFRFTNRALQSATGAIPRHVIGFAVERAVFEDFVREDLALTNYSQTPVSLTLELEIGIDFADLFEVRRHLLRLQRTINVEWEENEQYLRAEYSRQGYRAAFNYQFPHSDTPARHQGYALLFDLTLPPGGRWHARAHLIPEMEGGMFPASPGRGHASPADREAQAQLWREASAHVATSYDTLTYALRQSAEDLFSLLLDGAQPPGAPCVLAAGVPWFVALFGRDSLIAGLQTLMLNRSFALGALSQLAKYQAAVSDDFRDADPGKIPHELRAGELARLGVIPHTPYYGTADATILYPILLHDAYQWTGDSSLLTSYLPVAERCLDWIDRYGDIDGDGFQEYKTRSPRGIKHQGWKDSGDGVVHADGRPVDPPVALCELQGYVYDAKLRMAALYEAVGDGDRPRILREEADRLRTRFDDAFWMSDLGTYAFGLDARKNQIASIVSNAGHCLWSGIASRSRAAKIVDRLMAPDMWSGWGIRTLSADHPAFNPFAYQRGAVWPHDNALIALGFRRYGQTQAVARIARGILDAAAAFQSYRLPELLSGLTRDRTDFPVEYLGVNIPQAWAAASAFSLVQGLLGLQPDAPRGRLYVAPALPPWLEMVEVENLRVGSALVALRCWQDGGRSRCEVSQLTGSLQVLPVDEWAPVPVSD
jgi:glycogen debranching enzyme